MQHIQNILRVYHQASSGEMDAGLRWYLTAHEEATRIGHLLPAGPFNRHLPMAAGVIAATSPGLRWESNVEVAERIIQGVDLIGLGVRWYDGVKKAKRILAGEYPEKVLQGNKVNAFYDNIIEPFASDRVTIDGHAWAIWTGERSTLDNVPSISDALYSRIEIDYRDAAELMGIRASQLQAITWTTWRRLHSVSSAHYLPLFEE